MVWNSMDSDQVGLFVEPDLGPSCLQKWKMLADNELTLKAPRKNASENVVCWSRLL